VKAGVTSQSTRLLDWLRSIDQAAIDYDTKSDGMYPPICNGRKLSPVQILQAHKGQPTIEKRFEQICSMRSPATMTSNVRPRSKFSASPATTLKPRARRTLTPSSCRSIPTMLFAHRRDRLVHPVTTPVGFGIERYATNVEHVFLFAVLQQESNFVVGEGNIITDVARIEL
jgi:hypothetical protein